MNIIKRILPLLFFLGLSYWAIAPFFIQGFFPIHDDTQVQRVFEMKKALSDGMFPVRWVPDLGYNYGYPIFNFYAPLAYYIGGFIMFTGVDALVATKLMMALGIVLSGVTMYFFARQFWGEIGGVLSAVLYVYAPYHAIQIYVRGDVSEFWAYAFIPLVFLGIYKIYTISSFRAKSRNLIPQKSQSKTVVEDPSTRFSVGMTWNWIIVGSLGYAGIILSHNLTAMMVTPFLFVFALFLWSKNRSVSSALRLFTPLLLGILLASFYWLPTLAEMKYTNVLSVIGGGSDYKDHYVCPMQLWNSPWGFAGSASGCADGMSFKMGKLHIILTVLFIVGFFITRGKNHLYTLDSRLRGNDREGSGNDKKIVFFFIVALFISLFLMLEQSKFVWDIVPKMDFFQFPWRFLIMVSFLTAFLAGGILSFFHQKKVLRYVYWGISGAFIIVVVVFNSKVFNPQTISNVTVDNYTSKKFLTWITSKISDEYMPPKFSEPKNENEVPDRKIMLHTYAATIVKYEEKTQFIEAEIDAKEPITATVAIAYFPAWKFTIDDNPAQYTIFNKGVKVAIPEGRHIFKAQYKETQVEKVANYMSFAGFFALFLGIIIRRNKNDKETT